MAEKPAILVTGSEGLIGDAVVCGLHDAYDVVSFDVERPHKDPLVQDFIPCDLTKDESVESALETARQRHGSRFASVVHLAAYYDFSGNPSNLYQDLTIEGTRRLLRGLQSFEVEQFIFSSTLILMKPSEEGEPITEDSPVEAVWDYPKSKLATERIIRYERGRIPAVILRIGGVYNDDVHTVPIAQQIRRIFEKDFESFVFPGDAGAGQAFVHLEDVVSCIRNTIERRHELDPYEVFLIAEPEVMSYRDLQEEIGKLIHGLEWPTIRIPKFLAKAGAWVQEKLAGDGEGHFIKPWMIDLADDDYPVQIRRARERLGWEPKQRLRDTLPRMISRLKEDPERFYRENDMEPAVQQR